MKLMWRQLLSFVALIGVLATILTVSFVSVTNKTMYDHTWYQLSQYADSLIQDDEVLIDRRTN